MPPPQLSSLNALRPDLIIFDVFQPGNALGIPAVHFAVLEAATRAFTHHHYVDAGAAFPFPKLRSDEGERRSLYSLVEFLRANVFDFDRDLFYANFKVSAEVVLMKTCRSADERLLR